MSSFQLAQLNIAALREPLESPTMADFVANLERLDYLQVNGVTAHGFTFRETFPPPHLEEIQAAP